jgi:hypothetical protein
MKIIIVKIMFIFIVFFAIVNCQRPLTNSSYQMNQNNVLTSQTEFEPNLENSLIENPKIEVNKNINNGEHSVRAYNSNGNNNQYSEKRGRKASTNKMKEIRKTLAMRANNSTDSKRPGDFSSGLMSYRPAYNQAKDLRPLNLVYDGQVDDPDPSNKDPVRLLKKKFKNDVS